MRDKALSKKCIHERQHTRRWNKILFFTKDFLSVSSAPGFEVWAAALNVAHPGSSILDLSLEQSENKPTGSWSLAVWSCALGTAENSKESSWEWRIAPQAPWRKRRRSQGCWEEPEREMGERGWTMFPGARLGEVRRG